jgi:hypothetical protein
MLLIRELASLLSLVHILMDWDWHVRGAMKHLTDCPMTVDMDPFDRHSVVVDVPKGKRAFKRPG